MVYSLGMEPSEVGSQSVGGGVRFSLVMMAIVAETCSFYHLLINIH